jgi:hypothetical protein
VHRRGQPAGRQRVLDDGVTSSDVVTLMSQLVSRSAGKPDNPIH